MSNALTTTPGTAVAAPGQWDTQQIDVLRRTYAKDCNDVEFALFAQVCRHLNLDPFRRQIYAVKYEGQNSPVTFQTSIDGFRVIAKRSGNLHRIGDPEWCGEDGVWQDVWLSDEPPMAARVRVYTKDDPVEGVVGIARYSEYVATKRENPQDRNSRRIPNTQWTNRPAHMLAKCAEALAIRRAFPDDLGGLYTDDEMAQAGNYVDSTAEEVPTAGKADEVLYGTQNQTAREIYEAVKDALQNAGLSMAALRAIPGWEWKNAREGIEAWATAHPDVDVARELTRMAIDGSRPLEDEAPPADAETGEIVDEPAPRQTRQAGFAEG